MNNFQIRKYSRCFFYLLLLLFVLLFATISLLIYIKPPSLTKKNFFTISSRSPEYLLLPIPAEKLLTVQEKNYPFSKISPKNKFYDIVTIIRDWELIKKNDNLFLLQKLLPNL